MNVSVYTYVVSVYTYVVSCWSPMSGLSQRLVQATTPDNAIRDAAHNDGWTVDYSVPLETFLGAIEDHYSALNVTK